METDTGQTTEAGHIDFSASFIQSGAGAHVAALPLTLCELKVLCHTEPEGTALYYKPTLRNHII